MTKELTVIDVFNSNRIEFSYCYYKCKVFIYSKGMTKTKLHRNLDS